MKKKFFKIVLVLFCINLSFLLSKNALAETRTASKCLFDISKSTDLATSIDIVNKKGTGIFEELGACQKCGECSLCDFVAIFINISNWILSIMGGLALVYFVYAGVSFIISFGSSEKVESSKKTLQNTIIGIIVILGAWTIINSMFFYLTGNGSDSLIGKSPWSSVGGMCK